MTTENDMAIPDPRVVITDEDQHADDGTEERCYLPDIFDLESDPTPRVPVRLPRRLRRRQRTTRGVRPNRELWRLRYRKDRRAERERNRKMGFTGVMTVSMNGHGLGLAEKHLNKKEKQAFDRALSKLQQALFSKSLSPDDAARLEAEATSELNRIYERALRRSKQQARACRPRELKPNLRHVLARRTGTRCRARRTSRRAATSSSSARAGPDPDESDPPGSAGRAHHSKVTIHLQGLVGTSCGARDVISDLGVLS